MTIPVLALGGGKIGRGRLDDNWLGGELFSGKYDRRDIRYPTTPSKKNCEQGAAMLDDAMHRITGKRVVAGHSMGAQVWSMWLRTYGKDTSISPADVVFVGTGNLESKYGGGAYVDGAKALGLLRIECDYGGCGFPDSTLFRTVTISRQYDNFAHFPGDVKNSASVKNAYAGFFLHLDYSKVSLTDPANAVYVDPYCSRATYIIAPTYPLPSAPWWYSSASKRRYDERMRPSVDAAYDYMPYKLKMPSSEVLSQGLKGSDKGWEAFP